MTGRFAEQTSTGFSLSGWFVRMLATRLSKMLRDARTAGMRTLHRGVDRPDERLLWADLNGGYRVRCAGLAALPHGGSEPNADLMARTLRQRR